MAAVTVICVEAVPEVLRGALSRWMLEPITGTFVGPMPANVRDRVWEMVTASAETGRAVLVHSADNDQGFVVHTTGESRRSVVDFDGLSLIAFE